MFPRKIEAQDWLSWIAWAAPIGDSASAETPPRRWSAPDWLEGEPGGRASPQIPIWARPRQSLKHFPPAKWPPPNVACWHADRP